MQFEIPERLKQLWRPGTRVAVLTGAGISKESGVPTFRDKDGLWQKFKPEELASMEAFLANPKLVWEWYQHRREVVRKVEPNAGHHALVAMEGFFKEFTLATQNVDGLHTRAGHKRLLELHGNIMRDYCIECGTPGSVEEQALVDEDASRPPVCPKCQGRMRPDVVWFGEMLPVLAFQQAHYAAENCDLYLSIGTSGAVFPAAGLPLIAKEAGAYVVEINPESTEISAHMDASLRGPSAAVLPQLLSLSSLHKA